MNWKKGKQRGKGDGDRISDGRMRGNRKWADLRRRGENREGRNGRDTER